MHTPAQLLPHFSLHGDVSACLRDLLRVDCNGVDVLASHLAHALEAGGQACKLQLRVLESLMQGLRLAQRCLHLSLQHTQLPRRPRLQHASVWGSMHCKESLSDQHAHSLCCAMPGVDCGDSRAPSSAQQHIFIYLPKHGYGAGQVLTWLRDRCFRASRPRGVLAPVLCSPSTLSSTPRLALALPTCTHAPVLHQSSHELACY